MFERLGTVCDIDRSQDVHRELPYVGLEDIESHSGRFIGSMQPRDVLSSTFLFSPEHVLYGRLRPYLNKVLLPEFEGHCSTEILPLKPRSCLSRRFLVYWLLSHETVDMINATCTGTRMPRADMKAVLGFDFPLPPLPEQQRIVAILDGAFADIAVARANAEKNLRNARAVFESELRSIFTRQDGSWTDRRLSTVCERITVGHVGTMAAEYRPSGVPFLRSQNIRPFEVVLSNVAFVDDAFHRSLAKSRLRPGDLVIVRTGYPGTAAVIPDWLPDANCSDLVIVRPGSDVDPHYLAAFFNSEFGKALVGGNLVGAAQKHFNVTAAKNVMLRLPPVAEQLAIASIVDELRQNTTRLASIHQRKLAALDELKQSLLHQAFSGQLTAGAA